MPRAWFRAGGNYQALVDEARRHVAAAQGRPVEWHVSELSAAEGMRGIFEDEKITGITVVHTPASP